MVNYFRNDPTLSEEYTDVERFIDWIYYDGKSGLTPGKWTRRGLAMLLWSV